MDVSGYISQIREIILRVLEDFNKNNINYCILRNYEFLLNASERQENDIDVLINGKDLKKISEILKKYGFLDGRKGCTTNHIGYPKIIFKLDNIERRIGFDFHIDGLAYNGCYYLDGRDILFRKRKIYINEKTYFYVPSNEDYLLELLLHSILDKNYFKHKYKKIINNLLSTPKLDISYVENTLTKFFGKELSHKLTDLVLNRRYDDLLTLKWKLVFALCVNKPSNIIKLVWNLLRIRKINIENIIKKIYYFINPSYKAPLIAIIGVDGSGKTTIANELCKVLKDIGFNARIFYLGLHKPTNPLRLIIYLYNILRKSKNDKGKKTSNDVRYAFVTGISLFEMIRIFLRFFDLYIRYIRVLIARKMGVIAITDRFFYDLAVTTDKRIAKLLFKIFPKPNYVFYLYNNPKVIYKRGKDKLTENEIRRQMEKIESFRDMIGYISIRSDDVRKVIAEILRKVVTTHI